MQFIEKRAYERTSANLHVRFFYDDAMYTGTITNLSKNGLYIETERRLYYFKLIFKVHILLDNEVLEIHVRVKRLAKTNGFYNGIGVELLDTPKKYLEFVDRLKAVV